jgi:hypothetical protein
MLLGCNRNLDGINPEIEVKADFEPSEQKINAL